MKKDSQKQLNRHHKNHLLRNKKHLTLLYLPFHLLHILSVPSHRVGNQLQHNLRHLTNHNQLLSLLRLIYHLSRKKMQMSRKRRNLIWSILLKQLKT